MHALRRPTLPLLLASLAACGGGGDERPGAAAAPPAAAVTPTPDSVQVSRTAAQLALLGRPETDTLSWARLVDCPGGTGQSSQLTMPVTGGRIGLPSGDSLAIREGSVDQAYAFRLTDVADPRHRVVRVEPLVRITLPATLNVDLSRCPPVNPDSVTLVRLHDDRPAEDVGGQVRGRTLVAPVSALGDFAVAVR